MRILNRYEVLSEIGRGADGVVFAVRDLIDQRILALKQCDQAHGARGVERLRQEFRTLKRLSHPNIISAFDFEYISPSHPSLFTMELFYGAPILSRARALNFEQLVLLFSLAASALEHVHQRGLIHGDIKSSNVLVDLRTSTPDLRLADFSCSRHPGLPSRGEAPQPSINSAPELLEGSPPTFQTDIFALGMLFQESARLSGSCDQTVDEGSSQKNLRGASTELEGVAKGGQELNTLLQAMLAESPRDRLSSISEARILIDRMLADNAPDSVARQLTRAKRWPFAGRKRVLARAKRAIEVLASSSSSSCPNQVSPVFICGPAGIGKSRLLEVLRFESQYLNVYWAQASCRRELAPLEPIKSLLEQLIPRARLIASSDEECSAILHKYRALLGRVLSEETGDSESTSTWLEERATWIPDQLSRFLLKLATVMPFVIALDDIHCADLSTQRCIETLCHENDSSCSFLLLLSGRQIPPTGSQEWLSESGVRLEELAPLSAADLNELVKSLSPSLPNYQRLATELDRLAGGNPEHTEITLRNLIQAGAFKKTFSGFALEEKVLAAIGQPEEVKASVLAFVRTLPAAQRTALEALSLFNRPARADWLDTLAEVDGSSKGIADAVLDLAMGGIVDITGTPPDALVQFSHALLPEAVYGELGTQQVTKWHSKIADLLIAHGSPDSAVSAAEIASHLVRGGRGVEAARYALIAANLSARTFSLGEAESYYRISIENSPKTNSSQRLEALEGLGDTLIAGGRLDEAAEVLVTLKREASEFELPEFLARALAGLAEVELDRSNYDEAEELSHRSLRLAREVGDLRTEARAVRAVSDTYHFQSRLEEARASYSRLVALWESMNDEVGSASAWHNLGWVSDSMRDFPEARRCFKKAESIYRRIGLLPRLANTLAAQGANDIDSGHFLPAIEILKEALNLAGESRGRRTAALCHANLGQAFYRLGNFSEAGCNLRMASGLLQTLGAQRYLAPVRMIHGWLLTATGAFAEAEEELAAGRNTYQGLENQPGLASCLASQADIFRQLGDLTSAVFWAERSVEIAKASGDSQALASCLMSFGFATCCEGANQAGKDILSEGLAVSREIHALDTEHLISLVQCQAALVENDPEPVLRSVPDLLRRAEVEQLLADRPTLHLCMAKARVMTGEQDLAVQALSDAIETAEQAATHETLLHVRELHLAFARQLPDFDNPDRALDMYDRVLARGRNTILEDSRGTAYIRQSRLRVTALTSALKELTRTSKRSRPTSVTGSSGYPASHEQGRPGQAGAAISLEQNAPPVCASVDASGTPPAVLPGSAEVPGVRGVLNLLLDRAVHSTGSEKGAIFLTSRALTAQSGAEPDESPAAMEDLRPVVLRDMARESLQDASELSRSVLLAALKSGSTMTLSHGKAPGHQEDTLTTRARSTPAILATPIRISGAVPALPESAPPDGHDTCSEDQDISYAGVLYLERRISSTPYAPSEERIAWHFSAQAGKILALNAEKGDGLPKVQALDDLVEELDRESVEAILPISDGDPDGRFGKIELKGQGPAFRTLCNTLRRLAGASIPVLIQGETGTGKELAAQALHHGGSRPDAPFIAVDCGALSESLAESELFGHTRGAFSGAHRDRQGLLRSADGGTLFLDEIGNLSTAIQLKLLRALETREVRPLGSDRCYPTSFRLIAATNADLSRDVSQGRFRADLYHRLRGGLVLLPPLRKRQEDLDVLVHHFMDRLCADVDREVPSLSPAAWTSLRRHHWPGNVRELRLALEVALQFSAGGVIDAVDLRLGDGAAKRDASAGTREQGSAGIADGVPASLAGIKIPVSLEGRMLLSALVQHGWDKAAAARTIGWSRQRLYRQLKAHGLPLRISTAQLDVLHEGLEGLSIHDLSGRSDAQDQG